MGNQLLVGDVMRGSNEQLERGLVRVLIFITIFLPSQAFNISNAYAQSPLAQKLCGSPGEYVVFALRNLNVEVPLPKSGSVEDMVAGNLTLNAKAAAQILTGDGSPLAKPTRGLVGVIVGKDSDRQLAHEQMFFCNNGNIVRNVGFGPNGRFEESDLSSSYELSDNNRYDSTLMRAALGSDQCKIDDGRYDTLGNNCQQFATRIKSKYWGIYWGSVGLKKINEGNFRDALAAFDQSIKFDPNEAGVYNTRGVAKSNLGDTMGAISDYTKAIQINPKLRNAYKSRGISWYELGNKKNACDDLSKAIELGLADWPELYATFECGSNTK